MESAGLDGACSPPPVPQLGKKVAWGPTEVKFVSPLPPSAYFLSPTPTSMSTRTAFDEHGYFVERAEDSSSDSSVSLLFPQLSNVAFGETVKFSDLLGQPAPETQGATVGYDFSTELQDSARRDDAGNADEQLIERSFQAPISELMHDIQASTQRARDTANAIADSADSSTIATAQGVITSKQSTVGYAASQQVRRSVGLSGVLPSAASTESHAVLLPSARRALVRRQQAQQPRPPMMPPASEGKSTAVSSQAQSARPRVSAHQAAVASSGSSFGAVGRVSAERSSVQRIGASEPGQRASETARAAARTRSKLSSGSLLPREEGKGAKLFAQIEREGHKDIQSSTFVRRGDQAQIAGPAVASPARPVSPVQNAQRQSPQILAGPTVADTAAATKLTRLAASPGGHGSAIVSSTATADGVQRRQPAAQSKTRAAIEELRSVVTALREGHVRSPVRKAALTAMVPSDANHYNPSTSTSTEKQTASDNSVGRLAPPDSEAPGSPAAKLFKRANVVLRVAAGAGIEGPEGTLTQSASSRASSPIRTATPKRAYKALAAPQTTSARNGSLLSRESSVQGEGQVSMLAATPTQTIAGVSSTQAQAGPAVTLGDALQGQRSAHGQGRRPRSATGTPLPSTIRRPRSVSAPRSPPPVLPGAALARVALPPVVVASSASQVRSASRGAGGRYASVRRASAGSLGSAAVNTSTHSAATITQALTFSDVGGPHQESSIGRTMEGAEQASVPADMHVSIRNVRRQAASGHSTEDSNTSFARAVATALQARGGDASSLGNMTLSELLAEHNALASAKVSNAAAASSPLRHTSAVPRPVDSPYGSFPVVPESSLRLGNKGDAETSFDSRGRTASPQRSAATRTGGGFLLGEQGRGGSPPRPRQLLPGSLPVPITDLLPMLAASLDAPVANALAAALPGHPEDHTSSPSAPVRPLHQTGGLPDSITAAMKGELLHPGILQELADKNTSFSAAMDSGIVNGQAASHLLQVSRRASIPGAITGFLTAASSGAVGLQARAAGDAVLTKREVEIPAGPLTADSLVGAVPVLRGRGVASVYSVRPSVRPLGTRRQPSEPVPSLPAGPRMGDAADGKASKHSLPVQSLPFQSHVSEAVIGGGSQGSTSNHALNVRADMVNEPSFKSPKAPTGSQTQTGSVEERDIGSRVHADTNAQDGRVDGAAHSLAGPGSQAVSPGNVFGKAAGDEGGSRTMLLDVKLITAADCYGDAEEAERRNAELQTALTRMRDGQTASPVRHLPVTATVTVPTGTSSRVDAGASSKVKDPSARNSSSTAAGPSASIASTRRHSAAAPAPPTGTRTLKSTARAVGLASRLGSTVVASTTEPPSQARTPAVRDVSLQRTSSKPDLLTSQAPPINGGTAVGTGTTSVPRVAAPVLQQGKITPDAAVAQIVSNSGAASTPITASAADAIDTKLSSSSSVPAQASTSSRKQAVNTVSNNAKAGTKTVASEPVPASGTVPLKRAPLSVPTSGASQALNAPVPARPAAVPMRTPSPLPTTGLLGSKVEAHTRSQDSVAPQTAARAPTFSSNFLSADASARETIRAILSHQSKGTGRRNSVTEATDAAAALRRRGSIVLDSSAALQASIFGGAFSSAQHAKASGISTTAGYGYSSNIGLEAASPVFPYPIEIKDGRAYALVPLTAPQLAPAAPVQKLSGRTLGRELSSSSVAGSHSAVSTSASRHGGSTSQAATPLPYISWPQPMVYQTTASWPAPAPLPTRAPTIAGQRRLSTASSHGSTHSRASSRAVPHVGAGTLPGPMSPTTKLVHRLLGALAQSPDVHTPGARELKRKLQEQLLQEQQQLESNLQPAILEISLLMSTFSAELASQHDSVQYVSDAIVESNDNVIRGRSELQKAAKRPSFMKEFVVTFILVMAAALLLLDWITP